MHTSMHKTKNIIFITYLAQRSFYIGVGFICIFYLEWEREVEWWNNIAQIYTSGGTLSQ